MWAGLLLKTDGIFLSSTYVIIDLDFMLSFKILELIDKNHQKKIVYSKDYVYFFIPFFIPL